MFTQDYLKEVLHYDLETGIFTWKYRASHPKNWNNRFVGTQAGSEVCCMGRYYIHINIDRKTYKAHRLAWLYVYGECPEFIDHEDTNGIHNWITNLRPTTRSQNGANIYKEERGVFWDRNKYRVAIRVEGKLIYLGRFVDKEEAQAVYNKAAIEYFGAYARCVMR